MTANAVWGIRGISRFVDEYVFGFVLGRFGIADAILQSGNESTVTGKLTGILVNVDGLATAYYLEDLKSVSPSHDLQI